MVRSLGVLLVILAGCFASKAEQQTAGEEQEVFGLKAVGDVKPAPFDGKRALKYVEALCDIGPRQSGTPGMREVFSDFNLICRYAEVEIALARGKKTYDKRETIRTQDAEREARATIVHGQRWYGQG